jgi:hypothetical protein
MTEVTYEDLEEFMMSWDYNNAQHLGDQDIPDFYKLPVIGHVVIQNGANISTYPITSCDHLTDYELGGYELSSGEKFITVIPANTKMFQVCGYIPIGTLEEIIINKAPDCELIILGYEYEGLPAPDWDMKYREECVWRNWMNHLKRIELNGN